MTWDEFVFKPVKLNQYFMYERQGFLNFFAAWLLRKLFLKFLLALIKTLTNSEDFTESCITISFPAYKIFVVFYPMATIKKCIRNLHVYSKEGYGNLFRMFSAAFQKAARDCENEYRNPLNNSVNC
jgi:hypothetical protein